MRKILWALPVLLVGMMGQAKPVTPDAMDVAEAKRRGVPVELVQLESAKSRVDTLTKQVAELKTQLKAAQETIQNKDADMASANKSIAAKESEIAELKRKILALTPGQEDASKRAEIDKGIKERRLVIGMTVAEVEKVVGQPGMIESESEGGYKNYKWWRWVEADGHGGTATYYGTVKDGKLISFRNP